MIDSIFKRVSSSTIEALKQSAINPSDVNVDELTTALSSVKGDLKIAHSGLQRIYEEAHYVYARLSHMEQSISGKAASPETKKDPDEDDSGSNGGVVVEKHMFIGENHGDEKLSKIQEAKMLTQELLSSIESLSEKVKLSSSPSNTAPSMRI